MDCRRVEQILPLYVGGDVKESRARAVASHLRSCDGCRRLADEHRRGRELLQTFDAPDFGSEFFSGIRSAVLEELSKSPPRQSFLRRLQALFGRTLPGRPALAPRAFAVAALLLALALGVILSAVRHERPAPSLAKSDDAPAARAAEDVVTPKADESRPRVAERVPPARAGKEARGRTTPPRARKELRAERRARVSEAELLPGEESYLQAISALDALIRKNRAGMSPTLRAVYERHLPDVDRAIAGTRAAALHQRDDPGTKDFLFAAYRGKLALLSEIAKKSQEESAGF